jgi:uncharacterized protein (DUF362 family)/Pyruvate/2-oxoacid:ferredoxin oxidoreductase delta subunit
MPTPRLPGDVYILDLGRPDPSPEAVRQAVDRVFALTGLDKVIGAAGPAAKPAAGSAAKSAAGRATPPAAAAPSRQVLIKPNILAPVPAEMRVTTSPSVVRAVVGAVRAAGGTPWVGDNPGGVERNSLHTAEACGILAASDGCFRNLSDEVVEMRLDNPSVDKVVISKFILEADVVINLPVFKTHMLTTLTGAVKNCYGYVAGTSKARLHLAAFSRGRFAQLLLDLYALRVPDLHIVDALSVMEGNGPTHGRVRPYGKLVAGRDGLAVDYVLTSLMGVDPAETRLFQKAAERGLFSPEAVRALDGDGRPVAVEAIPDFALPSTIGVSIEEQAQLLVSLGAIRPVVKEDLCALCGDCVRNCPPQAITLDPFPVIDAGKCISCFCCAELCTEGAMEVPSGEAAGLFDRMFRGGSA